MIQPSVNCKEKWLTSMQDVRAIPSLHNMNSIVGADRDFLGWDHAGRLYGSVQGGGQSGGIASGGPEGAAPFTKKWFNFRNITLSDEFI
jgi:hypothetical protein